MKITSFYYLAYPDSLPPDPLVAASELYVEIAEDDGDLDSFDFTYSIHVFTVEYIRQHLTTHPYFMVRSGIVIESFDDLSIKAALDILLPMLDTVAQKK